MNKQNTYCLIVLFLFNICSTFAQIEVKIQPLSLIAGQINASAEVLLSKEISTELDLGFNVGNTLDGNLTFSEPAEKSGYKIRVIGKYFFNPDSKAEGWYAGMYATQRLRTRSENTIFRTGSAYYQAVFNAGVAFGVKWVGDNNIILEFSGGLGKSFPGERIYETPSAVFFAATEVYVDAYGRFSVGYRF